MSLWVYEFMSLWVYEFMGLLLMRVDKVDEVDIYALEKMVFTCTWGDFVNK
mgnify:CR=1 FL=1